MSFSILDNPFSVLGLSDDTPPAEVARRARQSDLPGATSAGRDLITPRSRLAAEVAFLPGASAERMWSCLDALRSGQMPDLSGLSAAARANVLAHLASTGKPSFSDLRRLAVLQEEAATETASVLGASHQKSGLPPISAEALDAAMVQLRSEHADAFGRAALAMPDGAEFLSGLITSAGGSVSIRMMFLREAAASWERGCLGSVSELNEHAEKLEVKLRAEADPATASQLAKVIKTWATATKPPRSACLAVSLRHQPSIDSLARWQSLTRYLVNEANALAEAATLLEALVRGFGPEGLDGEPLASGLEIVRQRLAAGEGQPEMRRLLAALEAVNASPGVLRNSGLEGGKVRATTTPVVAELHEAFTAAAQVAQSDVPWLLMRSLSLRLHNELSATDAALEVNLLALAAAAGNKAADEVRVLLEADDRKLRSLLLEKELEVALNRKQSGHAKALIARIIPLLEDEAARAPYRAALRQMQSQSAKKVAGGVVWAGIALVVLFAFWQSNSAQRGSVSPAQTHVASSSAPVVPASRPMPAAPYSPPASDRTETQPEPGSSVLTRAELRWCSYRKVSADAAETWLNGMQSSAGTAGYKVAGYNAAVDAYNDFIQPMNLACHQRKFYVADRQQVDAEVASSSSALADRGRMVVQSAYNGFAPVVAPPPRLAPPSYAQPAPAPPSPPPAAYNAGTVAPPGQVDFSVLGSSKAYIDGQQDRRTWDAWIDGLSGGYRDGAEWWAGVRSSSRPPPCSAAPSAADPSSAAAGCNAAKIRLAPSDRRRRAEPDYRQGWNNP